MDELNDGLVQLDSGSGELALRINEGSEQVPSFEGTNPARVVMGSWVPAVLVDLMRHTLFGTSPGDNRVAIAMTVLGLLGVAAFLMAMLGFWKERVLMEKDIHPELDV